jgi:hypothetical protein
MGVDSLQRTTVTHSARAKLNHQVMVGQNHPPTIKIKVQISRQARAKIILLTVLDVSLQAIRLNSFTHTILKI